MRIPAGYAGAIFPIAAGLVSGIMFYRTAKYIRTALVLLMFFSTSSPVRAQEIYLLGGILQNSDNGKSSYSWQLEYIEKLGDNLGLGVMHLNEGHVPNHHRDGNALHLWARTWLLDRRLSLAAGIGPYYYYDTIPATSSKGYENDHGVGAIFSSAVTWHTDSRWLFQLRANWVENFDNFNSFSALAGIGYQFGEPAATEPEKMSSVPSVEKAKNEITLYAGQTIVNSLNSQKSLALATEYRRRIHPYVDWTGTWLYEGDSRLTRRNGLASQLWAVRDFLNDRLSLGIGGGVYLPINERKSPHKSSIFRTVCGIITLTSSYTILPPWDVRVSWNRIITDYNHDADVILGGVGYRF
jgi:hypothetical protein